MFCYKCGQKLEDDAVFCGACGAKQGQADQPTSQQVQVSQQEQSTQQQFQQGMSYQQQQYQQPMYSVPQKTKNKLGWAWITIIVEGAVALVLLIAFLVVNIGMSSYMATAEKCASALVLGDANKFYDTLYITDDDLMSKESFVSIYGEDLNLIKGIASFGGVSEADITVEDVESDSDKAVVNLKYNNFTVDKLYLVREEKNRFLFFPSWKVDPASLVAKNVKIKVPKGAKIYVDDVEVKDEYRSNNGNEYVIPGLFKGKHTLVIETDDLKTLPSTFTASGNDNYVSVDSIAFSQEDQQKIIDDAYSYLQKVVNAHLAGQSFDSISSMYSSDSLSSERQSYESASKYDYAKTSEYGTGITDATISNVRGTFSSASIKDGKITVNVNLKYNNTNNGLARSYALFGSAPATQAGVDPNNEENESITLKYEDGKWVIGSLGTTGVDGNTYFYSSTGF